MSRCRQQTSSQQVRNNVTTSHCNGIDVADLLQTC